MAINARMLMALAVAGWAGFRITRAIRQYAQVREEKQEKVQLQTWEGEGGNLPSDSFRMYQDTYASGTKPIAH